jgi:UDP-N-acetylglucosamine 2-epimerase
LNKPSKRKNCLKGVKGGKSMNEETAVIYEGLILQRFFDQFRHIIYQGVPLCKFLYFQVLGFIGTHWSLDWVKENLPYLHDPNQFKKSEFYSWSDEPYPYDPHPDGIVLMRSGFVDIAAKFLPKERYFLISHTQAEVNLIKANMPDQTAHNIEAYFRDNPKAVADLNQQVAAVIAGQKDDPVLGSPDLLQWFKDNMVKIVHILDAVQFLFESMNIGAVLTISSINWMESALNLVARVNRIPSITGQHGLIIDKALYAHAPVLATKKYVWGKALLDWYQKYGFPESRISVTGSPRFDAIYNQKWCGKAKLCQMLDIDPSQKIIVFTTQRVHMSKINVPIALEGIKSIPNVFLVLLLHPSEAAMMEPYKQLTAGYSNCKVIPFGHISLYDALSGADIFVTYYSTSAFEAMFFKLPIVTIEANPAEYSYADAGASLRVTNSAEFNQTISKLIADENFRTEAVNQYQKYLSENCMPDGLASKRLFEEVESLCQSGGIA